MEIEKMSVKTAKLAGVVLPYDPHSDAGFVLIEHGAVLRDSNGHPRVFSERDADRRIAELES